MVRPLPDEVILGLLKAQPTHGYELLEYFRSRTHLGHIWTMSTSQLYAVLKRLEREGAIEGQEVAVQNAPTRVEYSVTETGLHQLETWLFDPHPSSSIHRIRVLFLSRIYLANLLVLSPEQIIKAQIQACQLQKDKFIEQKKRYRSDIELLTIEFVIQQLDSAIGWLKSSQFNFTIFSKEA